MTEDLIDAAEAARLTGISVHGLVLRRQRDRKAGRPLGGVISPPYRKVGVAVLHDRQAVIEWADQYLVNRVRGQ
ncbi:MAG: hypothetical protein ACPGOY_13925 [Rhodospirillaceae bacterium]